jgi:hypothetical protein
MRRAWDSPTVGIPVGQLNSSRDLADSKSRTEILNGGAARREVSTGLQR